MSAQAKYRPGCGSRRSVQCVALAAAVTVVVSEGRNAGRPYTKPELSTKRCDRSAIYTYNDSFSPRPSAVFLGRSLALQVRLFWAEVGRSMKTSVGQFYVGASPVLLKCSQSDGPQSARTSCNWRKVRAARPHMVTPTLNVSTANQTDFFNA
jgi:hypothetical protein